MITHLEIERYGEPTKISPIRVIHTGLGYTNKTVGEGTQGDWGGILYDGIIWVRPDGHRAYEEWHESSWRVK